MIAKAVGRHIRVSPRKTRLVADLVRGKSVDEARAILMNVSKRSRVYIEEILESAIANATQNPDIKPKDLYISKITVDGGPILKRYRAGSMGRVMMVRHRTSHILIELDFKQAHELPSTKAQVQPKGLKAKAKGLFRKKKKGE